MDFKSIHKTLIAEFATKKIRAELKATKKQELLESNATYKKLSDLEKEIVLELAKNKFSGKPTKELSDNLKEVRKQKAILMKKLGVSENDLKPKYECEICKDTGFVNGEMCVCYRKRRNEELLKACGVDYSRLASFDKFDTSTFENKKQAETLNKLKDKLVAWAEKYPDIKKRNLTFCGTPGAGKTFLTECLANLLISKNYSVCYLTAFELNNLFLKYHTTFDTNKMSILSPIINSDFLFIDDLGTEPTLKNITFEYLFLVLSEREKLSKPVIITTNLSPENILDHYGERIYSRIFNNKLSSNFCITGNDLRKK